MEQLRLLDSDAPATAACAIYTDGVHLSLDWTDWIVIGADDKPIANWSKMDDLHHFAQKIGLRREWFQQAGSYPHYDLTTPPAAERAVRAGALLVASVQEFARLSSRPGGIVRPDGWRPSLVGGSQEDRAAQARLANLALMRRFAAGRRVGRRDVYHLQGAS